MSNHFPITPPPELVQQWRAAASNAPASLSTDPGGRRDYIDFIATQAAQWGADQELEACCSDLHWAYGCGTAVRLRSMRRPKPPSLKEQALAAVAELEGFKGVDTIRRALEALDD